MIISHPKFLIPCMLLHATFTLHAYDVPGYTPDQVIGYKQTVNSSGGAVTLHLDVFTPPNHQSSDSRPAIVFFFGGGWTSGSPSQFHPHCEYLASRGMVAISAEYRVKSVHGTTPQECVKDGKSAIRHIRQHAAELGIDSSRIAAGGGSAGGHVAAATGTLSSYEEPGENLAISSKPNALILYNPVIDNGPDGYGYSTVQGYWQEISPLHNIAAAAPPTAFFLGTSDALIPVATAENYQTAMEAEGLRCDLHLYEGQPHGFFNFDVPDDSSGPFYGYQDTLFKTDEFLVSLGYLSDPHAAPTPATAWVTLFGDAGFSGGSAATASPVTTDADADGIAANFDPVNLADGGFVRLAGAVTLNAPLTGGNLRLGLFDGDHPVTAGDGTGYVGIWASAPATAATVIAAGDGTGSSHPFESAASTTLGPVPAAATTVPANTPIDFSLMIARNGDNLDITVSFTDGGDYHSSQNLLNVAVADYAYDSVAFLMTGNLNATQANFSNIRITSGPVFPTAEPPVVPSGSITYVDAVEGSSGNTFITGSTPNDTSWVGPDDSADNNTQWNKRVATAEGNGGTLFQGSVTTNTLPELTTRITGLADGTYTIWAFYWDQVDNTTQNWILEAGLTSGSLAAYSSPGEPAVSGTTKAGVTDAADLTFSNTVSVQAGWNGSIYLRKLFGINLGEVTAAGGAAVNVYVDSSFISGSSNRAWYDGVGYQPVPARNTFTDWISDFPGVGGLAGIGDDPDGDGNDNGVENFFGTDPSASSQGLVAGAVDSGAGTFTFTHPVSASPADDLTAGYQWSKTLSTFNADGDSFEGTTVTFSPGTPSGGFVTVTARITGNPLGQLFVKVMVTRN